MKITELPKEILILCQEYIILEKEQRWEFGCNPYERDWTLFTAINKSLQDLRKETIFLLLNREFSCMFLRDSEFREKVLNSVSSSRKQLGLDLSDEVLEEFDVPLLSNILYVNLERSTLPKEYLFQNIGHIILQDFNCEALDLTRFRGIELCCIYDTPIRNLSLMDASVKGLILNEVPNVFPMEGEWSPDIECLTICDEAVTDADLYRFANVKKKLVLTSVSILNLLSFRFIKELVLIQIPAVEVIPVMPQLEILQLLDCTAIREFPRLPNLRHLSLEYCTGIPSLDLSFFPNLRELILATCDGLQQLDLSGGVSFAPLYKASLLVCTNLEVLRISRNIGFLTVEDCVSLRSIEISDSHRVYSCRVENGRNPVIATKKPVVTPSIQGQVNILITPKKVKSKDRLLCGI
jgi:hypothetical protein